VASRSSKVTVAPFDGLTTPGGDCFIKYIFNSASSIFEFVCKIKKDVVKKDSSAFRGNLVRIVSKFEATSVCGSSKSTLDRKCGHIDNDDGHVETSTYLLSEFNFIL